MLNPTALGILYYYRRAGAWGNSRCILRTGIRAMGRNDIHLVPLEMGDMQETYIRPSSDRKSHVIAIDGAMAKTAGMNFPHLENGVAPTSGATGVMPPFRITSLWRNGRRGRELLDLHAAKATPSKPEPSDDIPEHGPHRFKDNIATASLHSAINSTDHRPHAPVSPNACTLRARVTPPHGRRPTAMNVAAELSSSPSREASSPRKSISPTPSQFIFPEIDRLPPRGVGADTARPLRSIRDASQIRNPTRLQARY